MLIGSVPATFVQPSSTAPAPAVLLLHGTASHRDEVGDLFVRLATALAERGIASLRIDFAGCGASLRPQPDFTVTSELDDARTALDWLRSQPSVSSVAVLGFSQGGMIALLVAASSDVAALVTWSAGVVSVDDRAAGFASWFEGTADPVTADLGFRTFDFSRQWWQEFCTMDLAAAAAKMTSPLLAVAGSADDVVPPSSSWRLVKTVAAPERRYVQIPGADHIFNALTSDDSAATELLTVTTDWLVTTLVS